ncbi:hypothetical protein [Paraburkholderia antibiotica]|uniref:Uncharacterized protein n=1 Tax=Paraburkholderia antibiotica TaxID=2728839 RepID=A0A7Y0A0Z8_9BURK|nr:hypothetical protein [Paraburkholderia antibiotica]NML34530.1 hypothetical protein [Paraburkholderia antibiotica]
MEPIFRSTDGALRYAFSFSTEQYGRSAMAGMFAPPGTGRGLSGMDGAGQAGMVRAELERLTPAQRAVLVVRYAPELLPCSCRRRCCSGQYVNDEFGRALKALAEVYTAPLFAGHLSNVRLRAVLIRAAILREKPDYTALGKQFGVDRNTVAKHAGMIERALVGTPREIGEFDRAYSRIEESLGEAGLIGEMHAA